MAHAHTVLHSVNLDGDAICVDIFRRVDGTFGFDEFRRDPEDGRGWYSIGHFGGRVYACEQDAIDAAMATVGWFSGLP